MKSDIPFRLVSFNVLAPCYHRLEVENPEAKVAEMALTASDCTTITKMISDEKEITPKKKELFFESKDQEHYKQRNEKIVDELLQTEADIILLQEFWVVNKELRDLYLNRIGDEYQFIDIQRSSHWRKRDDGLACLVRKKNVVIQDSKDIIFHDCGDRVAKMLLVALLSDDPKLPPQQLIVVNTHLLFPHNIYSTSIRKREMTKILGFVESYRQTELCSTVCNRSDVRVPVIVSGDFNGSPSGQVQSLLTEQRYRNAYVEYSGNTKWVSHKSHLKTTVPVDHVMYLNPSDQKEELLGPLPDWTNLVYREMYEEIVQRYPTSVDAIREAFKSVDQDKNNALSIDEFRELLSSLGFTGEGRPALTPEEVDLLIASADENGDGMVDFKEFLDRFWMARNADVKYAEEDPDLALMKGMRADSDGDGVIENQIPKATSSVVGSKDVTPTSPADDINVFARSGWLLGEDEKNELLASATPGFELNLDQARPCGDLKVKKAYLHPPELEKGIWPDYWKLSDHGLVIVDFLARAVDESDIQPWQPPESLRSNDYKGYTT
tara:strand:+ start:1497 stop:3149 length:1653 start_codon:yes stop_codon:yes gene_type:complete